VRTDTTSFIDDLALPNFPPCTTSFSKRRADYARSLVIRDALDVWYVFFTPSRRRSTCVLARVDHSRIADCFLAFSEASIWTVAATFGDIRWLVVASTIGYHGAFIAELNHCDKRVARLEWHDRLSYKWHTQRKYGRVQRFQDNDTERIGSTLSAPQAMCGETHHGRKRGTADELGSYHRRRCRELNIAAARSNTETKCARRTASSPDRLSPR